LTGVPAKRARKPGSSSASSSASGGLSTCARFAGTPVKRAGPDRFKRNVLIAAGNSRSTALLPLVRAQLTSSSPLVRAMAVWALRQLAEPAGFAASKAAYLPGEADPAVRAEWQGEAAA